MHIGDLIEALSKGNGHFTHGINWIESAAEFKSDEVRESFARLVKSRPIFHETLDFASYKVTEVNTLKRGQCIYQPPGTSKSPAASVRIVVAQEGDEWKVDGLFVD
jgi:hypothetical protein